MVGAIHYALYHTKPGDVGSKADDMRSLKHGHQQDGIKTVAIAVVSTLL